MKRDGVELSRSGSFHKVIRLGHLQCQPNHANGVMPYSCGIARIATPPWCTPDRAPYPQSGVAPSFHPGRFVVKRHRARSAAAGELTTQILRFPYHNQPRTEWRIAPCGKPANTHSQHNPQSGIYRAETPRRREPKSPIKIYANNVPGKWLKKISTRERFILSLSHGLRSLSQGKGYVITRPSYSPRR